jgi:hypothetical protein
MMHPWYISPAGTPARRPQLPTTTNPEPSEIEETKKIYGSPELVELGDLASLTNYDISVRVP